jgi:hypothetical protein
MTMIHKKDDKSDPNNYRPISLGKLIVRVINKRLYNYIESKNFRFQISGFRIKRRCADNLLLITQKVKESLNRKKKALLLQFDIQKAFDKVWHQSVIHKMRKMKILDKLDRGFLARAEILRQSERRR